MYPIVLFLCVFVHLSQCGDLSLIASVRTSTLEYYEQYVSTLLIAVNIPKDTAFVAVQFSAEELDTSYFSSTCAPRNVSMYMKYGAPPVINPDGSKFPSIFKNITRQTLYNLEFQSDKSVNYVNITSPLPGQYMAVVFLAYRNSKNSAITQQGLTKQCQCFVESKVYINKTENIEIVAEEEEIQVTVSSLESKTYKFSVQPSKEQGIVLLNDITITEPSQTLMVRIGGQRLPNNDNNLGTMELNSSQTAGELLFFTMENRWHYLELQIKSNNNSTTSYKQSVSLKFKLRFFAIGHGLTDDVVIKTYPNRTEQSIHYNNTVVKQYKTYELTDAVSYKEYALIRDSSSDNFLFSYLLEDEVDSPLPIALNISSSEVSIMKFLINERDVGGTAQFVMAFKTSSFKTRTVKQNLTDLTVVACIRPYNLEIPRNDGFCHQDAISTTKSPILLNKTIENASILIPFPETGLWYTSFRLFCGTCTPCQCPFKCKQLFTKCMSKCYRNCTNQCNQCHDTCADNVVLQTECSVCANCDGPCMKTNQTCRALVVFDISSTPCVAGSCGPNGRCSYMISSGIAFSTCLCTNNYRGWACTDDSMANSMYMVVLELLLLVLSNLAFLPAVYLAFRRNYYTEAVVYFSICFFSTFYHACDAGENLISFCIAKRNALQFADFFSALFAIWCTLIAIADLLPILANLCHIIGAIVIAFTTTIDKTSLWVFLVPSVAGVLIIICSWVVKYRKIRQIFCKRIYLTIYLPLGFVLAVAGLCIFTLLQTQANYKYLHSLWHVVMAVAITMLLPARDTFKPDLML